MTYRPILGLEPIRPKEKNAANVTQRQLTEWPSKTTNHSSDFINKLADNKLTQQNKVWVNMYGHNPSNSKLLGRHFPGEEGLPPSEVSGFKLTHHVTKYDPISNRPERLWIKPRLEMTVSKIAKFRDFITVGGVFFVRRKLANLLRQFDMGANVLHDVEFSHDLEGTKPIDEHFTFLHLLETKDCFEPEQTEGVVTEFGSPTKYMVDSGVHKIAVNENALGGVDLWACKNLSSSIFFSDRLQKAIADHGFNFGLVKTKQCKLV